LVKGRDLGGFLRGTQPRKRLIEGRDLRGFREHLGHDYGVSSFGLCGKHCGFGSAVSNVSDARGGEEIFQCYVQSGRYTPGWYDWSHESRGIGEGYRVVGRVPVRVRPAREPDRVAP